MVRDPGRGVLTPVLACRSCKAPVYFGYGTSGRRTPFNLDDNHQPTRVSHFTTCSDPKRWSKKQKGAA
jgi:hypothetical protein